MHTWTPWLSTDSGTAAWLIQAFLVERGTVLAILMKLNLYAYMCPAGSSKTARSDVCSTALLCYAVLCYAVLCRAGLGWAAGLFA